jgi:hypothetical protein
MLGSVARTASLPSLPSLLLRTLIVAVLVLGMGYWIDGPLAKLLEPGFAGLIQMIEPDLTLYSADIAQDGMIQRLRFRGNLTVPVQYAGHTVYPIGWNGGPTGWYQIEYSLTGALLYPSLLLIGVLSWPSRGIGEMGARLLITLPFLAVLLVTDVPTTVVAELWNKIAHQVDPNAISGWMIWSRFLMGGGGLVLSLVLTAGTISLSRRWVTTGENNRAGRPLKAETAKESGLARLLIPKRPQAGD